MRRSLLVVSLVLWSACSGASEPAPPPPTSAPPTSAPPTSAPPASVVAAEPTWGTLTNLDHEGTATRYVEVTHPGALVARTGTDAIVLGTRPVVDTADPEDPALDQLVQVASGPAPFATMTLVGDATCEVQVVRQIEARVNELAPDGTVTPRDESAATLLEIAGPCTFDGSVLMGIGGAAVTWAGRVSGTPSTPELAAAIASLETERGAPDPSATPTSMPIPSRADTFYVEGHEGYLVRGGAATPLEATLLSTGTIGGEPYFLELDVDGDELRLVPVDDVGLPAPTEP